MIDNRVPDFSSLRVRAVEPGIAAGQSLLTVIVIVGLLLACLIVVGVILVWNTRLRRYVEESSIALRELRELNAVSSDAARRHGTISQRFRVTAQSKAKYDRYDLSRHMREQILENEQWYAQEIEKRLHTLECHSVYLEIVRRIAEASLGRSAHARMSAERFIARERKLFDRQQLPRPRPRAQLVATISYTSPRGKNSYSRNLEWDFEQLRRNMNDAQLLRAKQSTEEARRTRERSLMTTSVRMDILRRDGFRCQMCGTTARDGARLHVDHITPVSRGGRTVVTNLQTLCEACNLGKGNRFIG